jgi:hypothetical protein
MPCSAMLVPCDEKWNMHMATQTNAVMLAGDAMHCKWFVFFSLEWNRYLIKNRCLVVLFGCVAEMPTHTDVPAPAPAPAAQRFSHKHKRHTRKCGVCCVASDAGLFVWCGVWFTVS